MPTAASRRGSAAAPVDVETIRYVETSAVLAALLEGDAAALRSIRRRGVLVTSALTFAEAQRGLVRARGGGRDNRPGAEGPPSPRAAPGTLRGGRCHRRGARQRGPALPRGAGAHARRGAKWGQILFLAALCSAEDTARAAGELPHVRCSTRPVASRVSRRSTVTIPASARNRRRRGGPWTPGDARSPGEHGSPVDDDLNGRLRRGAVSTMIRNRWPSGAGR